MSARFEVLELISGLSNEVQMFEVDREESMFEDSPAIIERFKQVVAVLERIYPMIQCTEEVLEGSISPKLFKEKWMLTKMHFDFPDGDVENNEIGNDVKGLLGRFGSEGDIA